MPVYDPSEPNVVREWLMSLVPNRVAEFLRPQFESGRLIPQGEGQRVRQLWEQSIAPQQEGTTYIGANIDWGNLAKAALGTAQMLTSQPELFSPLIYAGKGATGFNEAARKFSNVADRMPRFEISDLSFKWKGPNKLIPDAPYKLTDLIDHPELFKNYPELKNVEVYPMIGDKSSQQGNIINLAITSRGTPVNKKTLLHEIQHWVQDKEGFAKGGSPDNVYMNYYKEAQQMNPYASNTELSSIASKKAHDYYYRIAGEIEARDVKARQGLIGEERLRTPPYSSEDIPLKYWIVR